MQSEKNFFSAYSLLIPHQRSYLINAKLRWQSDCIRGRNSFTTKAPQIVVCLLRHVKNIARVCFAKYKLNTYKKVLVSCAHSSALHEQAAIVPLVSKNFDKTTLCQNERTLKFGLVIMQSDAKKIQRTLAELRRGINPQPSKCSTALLNRTILVFRWGVLKHDSDLSLLSTAATIVFRCPSFPKTAT